MNEINEILLRRKNKVNLPKRVPAHNQSKSEKAMIVSIADSLLARNFLKI